MTKRNLVLFSILFSLLPKLCGAESKIKVVATLPVFGSIAQEIGGTMVDVVSLAQANQDPHFIDPKPSYVVQLSRADILLHGGLELESGWLPPLLQQSRNPNILPQSKGNIDLSRGITILEIPQGKLDRSAGDVHPSGNPHFWMDPRNALILSRTMVKTFSEARPAQADLFAAQGKVFENQLKAKINSWEKSAEKLRGKKVITYHKSFTYLTQWLGIDIVDYIEPKPGIPPSSAHIQHLIELNKSQSIMAIVSESFYPSKMPQYVSEKIGKPFLKLETDSKKDQSYIDFMEGVVMGLVK